MVATNPEEGGKFIFEIIPGEDASLLLLTCFWAGLATQNHSGKSFPSPCAPTSFQGSRVLFHGKMNFLLSPRAGAGPCVSAGVPW